MKNKMKSKSFITVQSIYFPNQATARDAEEQLLQGASFSSDATSALLAYIALYALKQHVISWHFWLL